MQPVAEAVREKGKKEHLFVCTSTTTPGAVDTVLIPMLERETGGVCGRDFGVCYNPEFIALGNVVKGLLEPDMVLIGESTPPAARRWRSFTNATTATRPASPACPSSAPN